MKTKKKVKPFVIVGYVELSDFKGKWEFDRKFSSLGKTKHISSLLTKAKVGGKNKVRITVEVLDGN